MWLLSYGRSHLTVQHAIRRIIGDRSLPPDVRQLSAIKTSGATKMHGSAVVRSVATDLRSVKTRQMPPRLALAPQEAPVWILEPAS